LVLTVFHGEVVKREDSVGIVEEFEYRELFIDRLQMLESKRQGIDENTKESNPQSSQTEPGFDFPELSTTGIPISIDCTVAPDSFTKLMKELQHRAEELASHFPGAFVLRIAIDIAFDPLQNIIASDPEVIEPITAIAVANGIITIMAAMEALSKLPMIGDSLSPLLKVLAKIKVILDLTGVCKVSQKTPKTQAAAFEETHCNDVADIYRSTISESLKTFPLVAEDAPENLKRMANGASLVLDLMDKTSVPKSNDHLFYTKPVFSGDLLNQFRDGILNEAEESEDINTFAQISLALSVSSSNALEACMYVASDASATVEKYAESLIDKEDIIKFINGDQSDDDDLGLDQVII
jgi:hypothetical protein